MVPMVFGTGGSASIEGRVPLRLEVCTSNLFAELLGAVAFEFLGGGNAEEIRGDRLRVSVYMADCLEVKEAWWEYVVEGVT